MSRHFLFSAVLLFLSFVSFGQYQVQSKYFVYLQTEPAQPFYIKINGQNISANASGYLILPQLKDGEYKLVVGFPQNKVPEQTFKFKIDSKDKGYLIKDYGAEGWGLFDLQTMSVQKANNTPEKVEEAVVKTEPKKVEEAVVKVEPKVEPKIEEKPKPVETAKVPEKKEVVVAEGVSDFTKVLAQAAKDPSLLEKPKPEPIEEKPVEVQKKPEPKKEEVIISQNNMQSENTKPATNTTNTSVTWEKSNIITQSQSPDGLTVVYENRNAAGQVDPITIFIPAPHPNDEINQAASENIDSNVNRQTVVIPPTSTSPIEVSTAPVGKEKELVEGKIQGVMAQPETKKNIEVTTTSEVPIGTEPAVSKSEKSSVNTLAAKIPAHCKSVATEEDFLKLRRAMANESNDDNMINQAKTAFEAKCFTTSQIKYLGSMFLSNAGKFHFFEAAKGHISDAENFASLVSELKDQTFKDRFNALLQ